MQINAEAKQRKEPRSCRYFIFRLIICCFFSVDSELGVLFAGTLPYRTHKDTDRVSPFDGNLATSLFPRFSINLKRGCIRFERYLQALPLSDTHPGATKHTNFCRNEEVQ